MEKFKRWLILEVGFWCLLKRRILSSGVGNEQQIKKSFQIEIIELTGIAFY